jgi:hypothetical protein
MLKLPKVTVYEGYKVVLDMDWGVSFIFLGGWDLVIELGRGEILPPGAKIRFIFLQNFSLFWCS